MQRGAAMTWGELTRRRPAHIQLAAQGGGGADPEEGWALAAQARQVGGEPPAQQQKQRGGGGGGKRMAHVGDWGAMRDRLAAAQRPSAAWRGLMGAARVSTHRRQQKQHGGG